MRQFWIILSLMVLTITTLLAKIYINPWWGYVYRISHEVTNSSSVFDLLNYTSAEVREYLNQSLTMTILKQGRLGNAMFQYAVLLGMSAKTEHKPVIPTTFNPLLTAFSLSIPVIPDRIYRMFKFMKYKEHWVQSDVNKTIKNITEQARDKHLLLDGYFQSYLYFNNVRDIIYEDFAFLPGIQKQIFGFFENHLRNANRSSRNVTTVGIHVRLTDMNNWGRSKGLPLPPNAFFAKAMEYFIHKYHNVYFIICSDNTQWVSRNIQPQNITKQVVFSNFKKAELDLAMLTICDHVIITRGTFSWWAGYLNKGTTIYYKDYASPNSIAAKYYKPLTYIPQDDEYNHWIPIGG